MKNCPINFFMMEALSYRNQAIDLLWRVNYRGLNGKNSFVVNVTFSFIFGNFSVNLISQNLIIMI